MTPDAPREPAFDAQDHSSAPESPALSIDRSARGSPADRSGGPPPLALSDAAPGLPRHLKQLADRARDYIKASSAENTRRAYGADWRHYTAWCRRQNLDAMPPNVHTIGLYITACAAGQAGPKPNAVSTIERRLSALSWHFRQRGLAFDRQDRHVATVLAGIRRTHGRPPVKKEAVLPEDVIAMLETLDRGNLRGLRDRAMLLIGFTGGLRRSEIVGLDVGPEQTKDGSGWIEILDKGIVVTLRGKTGWREIEIGRGSSDATCPVVNLQTWLRLAQIGNGPLFRRVRDGGKDVGANRLTDKQVARLVKAAALAAGVRADLPEDGRKGRFAGHSLRAGLASSAEVDERYVQKQLGHASAEQTRGYQRRRDRFRVNLTKAAGL